MKVTFMFNSGAKIILTPDSKRDEQLVKYAQECGPASIGFTGDNSIEIVFKGEKENAYPKAMANNPRNITDTEDSGPRSFSTQTTKGILENY